ncbi:adenylyltransferase/cytidyltransferase family protein [Azospirillum oryzae]|uniref:adenylyltransferase/cytidyltransferase family protein n=1 Tax=Azospirillum oryzae TaxID=286727 RepID=UPI000A147778|nr:adenylyltransferase/cytidyltransferase family protein [Azospirillum oryzae]
MRFSQIIIDIKLSKPQYLGYVSGVFDVFHQGHQKYIEKCQQKCDALVIGVDSDHRVKEMKGPSRPFDDQYLREKNVERINEYVFVKMLPSSRYINVLRPNVLFYPSDAPEKGEKLTKLHKCCKVIMIEVTPSVSSTNIINSIVSSL